MCNIAQYEHVLERLLAGTSRALLHMGRRFGGPLPDEGELFIVFDDSIITDTAQEKVQDMNEVGVTMARWEFRQKRYSEDRETACKMASEVETDVRALWAKAG